MKLSREQSQKLLLEHGIWITEACDKCVRLLGAVRWTRKGEPGEWCSQECRDGIAAAAKTEQRESARRRARLGFKPSGRPRKHESNAQKCRQYRNRREGVAVTRNTHSEVIENAQVADVKNRSLVVSLYPATEARKLAPTRELVL